MKVIYSQTHCPACVQLKNKLKQQGEQFIEIVIGEDITKEEFFELFPSVRTVPHVVNTNLEDR